MFNILYKAIFIFLSVISILLLFYLIYRLAIYFYNVTPHLIRRFKKYRNFRKMKKGFVKYYE